MENNWALKINKYYKLIKTATSRDEKQILK